MKEAIYTEQRKRKISMSESSLSKVQSFTLNAKLDTSKI